ncbi:MAG: HD domain-containing protein [Bacillota bacterium]|jgi:putative hydrolase of HD superfamily
MDYSSLQQQLDFIIEADKLKQIVRQTLLLDQSRRENDAEHSWHAIIAALVLAEYAACPELDLLRVVKMLAIHDLVEIDAGDTYAYDELAQQDQAERERKAADRIFSLLPATQAAEFRAIWDEFEEQRTPEAQFAGAVDCLMPILHNYWTKGRQWQNHAVTKDRVMKRNSSRIAAGSEVLAAFVRELLDDAVRRGYLLE